MVLGTLNKNLASLFLEKILLSKKSLLHLILHTPIVFFLISDQVQETKYGLLVALSITPLL